MYSVLQLKQYFKQMGKERTIMKIKYELSSPNPSENDALQTKDNILKSQPAVFNSVSCFTEIRKHENQNRPLD